jgi:hypothetical protein
VCTAVNTAGEGRRTMALFVQGLLGKHDTTLLFILPLYSQYIYLLTPWSRVLLEKLTGKHVDALKS